MTISPDDIRHLAGLSRLKLEDEKIDAYAEDLASILGYVAKLAELDTSDVPEMAHAADLVNVRREDVVEGCDADVRERLLKAFPRREGDLLEVNAVFENRTE